MATDMTASGWQPSNVQVLKSWRPWGPQTPRHALVQFQIRATDFGGGADFYPGEGIPAPSPSLVGFREGVEYIIPVQPFIGTTGAGRFIDWGCTPPTGGVSGTTPANEPRLRIRSHHVTNAGVSTVTGAGFGILVEAVSTLAASTLFTTNGMTAVGIFVGK